MEAVTSESITGPGAAVQADEAGGGGATPSAAGVDGRNSEGLNTSSGSDIRA